MDRLMVFRPPRGGIPGADLEPGGGIVARAPVYGTGHAGGKFWQKVKQDFIAAGFTLNRIMNALFSIAKDGDILGMCGTHVDDFLYGVRGEATDIMQRVLDGFGVQDTEDTSFRYCGKEFVQSEDFSIMVTCRDTTEKLHPIRYDSMRKLTALANDQEKSQLLSVIGSLSWIARQCRPNLSFDVSRLQSLSRTATIRELRDANKTVERAMAGAEEGLFFTSSGIDWKTAVLLTVTDASFANVEIGLENRREPLHSQQGMFHFLASPEIVDGMQCTVHPIGYSSTSIRRVCRATMQTETYALQHGVESGLRLRAVIVEARGLLDLRSWETSAAAQMRHLWLSDCRSLVDHLKKAHFTLPTDKRLAVELLALRQLLWERNGAMQESILQDSGDMIRWVDTSRMLADCLTKSMKCDVLQEVLATGLYDMTPTKESTERKRISQACRQKARAVTQLQREQMPETSCDVADSQ